MKTLSKTLERLDLNEFDEHEHVLNVVRMFQGKTTIRFEHHLRKWEYGIALKALRENDTKTVLDVGGGGSAFAPSAAWLGMEVHQVDPGNFGGTVSRQSDVLGKVLTYEQEDFFTWKSRKKYDAVVCLSVLEHVLDDKKFFLKLLKQVKAEGLFVLTLDFHPSGESQLAGHLRTYNDENLNSFITLAKKQGFEFFGGTPDYSVFEPNVNNYTFVSLVMRRKKSGSKRVRTNPK